MKNHESTTLTDKELDSLVYLWWQAPALFSHEILDDEYMPLVQKGYAYVEEASGMCPLSLYVHITQKGKEAVLKAGSIRIIGAYTREGFLHVAERLISVLPKKLLPELLTYNVSGNREMYIRYCTIKRLDQLDKRENLKNEEEN